MSWFVMLNLNDKPTPMVDYDESVDGVIVLYPTEDLAEQAAWANPLGQARGFEVYEWRS